jgi:predicted NAD/FAD-binding protein
VKIAIIGSGIAGNVAAYRLHREHEITVFEAGDHVGGHTHTHAVEQDGRTLNVDTGFIVFNDWTYPNFIALLHELGVESQESEMSFSVKCDVTGLEYNGTTINSLFAQRSNLLRPSFLRMIRDILRFNREAPSLLAPEARETSLGDYLRENRYSTEFKRNYILPMGAAIWSASPTMMLDFPARYFVRFFHNHGMLSVDRRPTWRTIRGGSARYVEKLTAPFRDRIRLNAPVEAVHRTPTHVVVKPQWGEAERFDAVFLACHSDQALRMLADPTPAEREVLGAIPYQRNDVVLHTDTAILPKRKLAWAAWNYHLSSQERDRVAVTYNMNNLQRLGTPTPLLVTLNMSDAIDPAKIVKQLSYEHPVYTPAGVAAQSRQAELNVDRTYFCGAYWRNGFHEDGVVSALNALEHFRLRTQEGANAQRYLYRTA